MSIESTDILKYLGYGDSKFESVDDFKKSFEGDYGKRDVLKTELKNDPEFVKTLTGKALGSITTKIVTMYKDAGIEIASSETDDTVENVAQLGLTRLTDQFNEQTETLKADAAKNSNDKVVDLTAKLETATRERNQIEEMLTNTKSEHEQFVKKKDSELMQVKTDVALKSVMTDFKWKPNATGIEKTGFNTLLHSKYNFSLGENDSLEVTDKEGNKIPNPEQNSTFKTPKEVITSFGIEQGVYDMNDGKRTETSTAGVSTKVETGSENTNNGKDLTGDGRFRIHRTTQTEKKPA